MISHFNMAVKRKMTAAQLVLDLPHRPALGMGDFFISPSNAAAVGWIDHWPDWPSHALLICGPAASGKTHLAHVWQRNSKAVRLVYPDLESCETVLSSGNSLVIEDIDIENGGPGCEQALFHAYNWTREQGSCLLMTADRAPAAWTFQLADLASRMKSVMVAEISSPDDSLLSALLLKLFDDRQLKVGSDVLLFLLSRMERSFAGAARLVDALDRMSLAKRRNLTIPLARDVLKQLGS